MAMITIPEEILQEGVALVADAGKALDKMAAELEAYKQQAPMAVETLLDRGIIDEFDKAAAVEELKDPRNALNLLVKLSRAVKPRSMGNPAKQASADVNNGYTSKRSAADEAFESALIGGGNKFNF